VLFVLAFLLRFVAVYAARDPHRFHGMQAGSDAVEYDRIGQNLAKGNGYAITPGHPTSLRDPGFPFLLAGIYTLSFKNYYLVYMAQCLMGALTCLLTYFLARMLLPEFQARIASLLAAVCFGSIYYDTLLLSEPLFSLCLAAGLLLFIQNLKNPSVWRLALAGMILGYSTLVRPIGLLFLPALLPLLLWTGKAPSLQRIRNGVVFAALSLGVIAPWIYRNTALYGKLVLVATNGGSTFYGSNNDRVLYEPRYWGGWITTVGLPGRNETERAPNQAAADAVEWRLGLEWVRAHALDMPRLELFKFVRFWLPDIGSENPHFVLLDAVTWFPMLALLIVAAVRRLPQREFWSPPWLAIHASLATAVLTALVFAGNPRYRDADFPLIAIYAASAFGAKSASRQE
jgi:4-amino-4-deoxy-L-arabinose transferase-like glycosyltransferase